MPRDPSVKKVMVIGSGPIIIGQAAEFDYAGTQACQALREEGCEVVLVNSNLATKLATQGILDKYGVRLLGTPLQSIRMAEDREEFRSLMTRIGEPVPESWIIESVGQLK